MQIRWCREGYRRVNEGLNTAFVVTGVPRGGLQYWQPYRRQNLSLPLLCSAVNLNWGKLFKLDVLFPLMGGNGKCFLKDKLLKVRGVHKRVI